MADEDDRILAIELGGKPIRAHLEAAEAAGQIARNAQTGTYRLTKPPHNRFIRRVAIRPGEFGRTCKFLNDFLFRTVYGNSTVPWGCRGCHKVKVLSTTMRQLMAVKTISEETPLSTKSGSELASPEHRYATYIYTRSLDEARTTYKTVRARIDADPALGPAIKVIIKRGCTNYETNCGPSDRYALDPRLAEVEDYFHARFEHSPRANRDVENTVNRMQIAWTACQIGDETYKDFTGGKEIARENGPPPAYRPKPSVVTYPPEPVPEPDRAR